MLINFHKMKSAAEKLKTFYVLTQILENLKFPQNGQVVFLGYFNLFFNVNVEYHGGNLVF